MLKFTKTLTAAMLCVAMALCVSCKKNNAEPTTQIVATVTTNDVTEITQTSAVCGGEVVNENGCAVNERGVCWGITEHPTPLDSHIVNGEGLGKFTSTLTGLEIGTTYYIRAYAINAAGTSYGEERSFTTLKCTGTIDGHEYVDLGLPSGLLWATCNVGAENIGDYGGYFAWGETTANSNYDWSTYQWCDTNDYKLTKYCTVPSFGYNGFVDDETELEMADDAARANWGGDWRMPTETEMKELKNKCTWTWTTQHGKNGCLVTGLNNNSIFLPAAGFYAESDSHLVGSDGYYWSSSLISSEPNYAYVLNCHLSVFGIAQDNSCYRHCGLSVRPVRASQK